MSGLCQPEMIPAEKDLEEQGSEGTGGVLTQRKGLACEREWCGKLERGELGRRLAPKLGKAQWNWLGG